ncbi:response regulator [Spirosoma endbachense]|uniref:Response regulator n=1 Tax=Spirosoma endbachense TaxID=2666025 RepID=A0A6P1VW80_9BACT|nr:response regulator [Spirosoma endbachense]QHV97363.1 response regulator [Spirosoma endbachense]
MDSPITCLLIDDDEDDQEIFLLALRKLDSSIACSFVDDGAEALRKLRQDETFVPQYIFLDLNMPGMNGKQCLTEIKKIAHLQHALIFIYSTSSEAKDILETKQLGADGFITKPAQVSDLIDELSKLLLNC